METIFWIYVTLLAIAVVSVVAVIRKHNKMFEDEDPVPIDDLPGQYEDYEVSERPFIEFN